MSAAPQPQVSIYETTIEDPELERLLEAREVTKAAKGEAAKAYKTADAAARAGIERIELGVGAAVRVGRFVVSMRPVAAREVAFSTDPTTRLQISLLADE